MPVIALHQHLMGVCRLHGAAMCPSAGRPLRRAGAAEVTERTSEVRA